MKSKQLFLGLVLFVVGFGVWQVAARAMPEQSQPKPGSKSVKKPVERIVITHGIVGGIVAPIVRLQAVVLKQPDGKIQTGLMKHDDKGTHTFCGTMSQESWSALWKMLDEKGLWKLPVETPKGSQDIYQLDIGLQVDRAARSWWNSAPGGCIHGHSTTQPTSEQKARFKEIVQAITAKIEETVRPCSEKEFPTVDPSKTGS